jgi:hypothetical protein
MSTAIRPLPAEADPYWQRYISLVGEGEILSIIEQEGKTALDLFRGLTEEQGTSAYAPGKWTTKEVVGHIIDTERVMSYRVLRISRNDTTPMEGFEQDDYVANGAYSTYSVTELADEFETVRRASLLQLRKLTPDMWTRRGIANHKDVSVRALAYIIAGHELHHRKILKEKYL